MRLRRLTARRFRCWIPSAGHCNRGKPFLSCNRGASNVVVTEVKYDAVLPWPTNTSGTGNSLQLIDSRQDNWRVANWAAKTGAGSATPGANEYRCRRAADISHALALNEVEPNNITGITDSAGQHAAWLELYNPAATISLTGIYLANNYTNPLQWTFPARHDHRAGSVQNYFRRRPDQSFHNRRAAHEFCAADGHRLAGFEPDTASARRRCCDYVDYSNLLSVNGSYGSSPDGQSFVTAGVLRIPRRASPM